jgi:hypothetical protein
MMAIGTAALLAGQAAHANSLQPASPVDPLVTVSLLGTPQSRAAVCASSPGCGLPATDSSPAVVAAAAAAAAAQDNPRRESRGVIWILLLGGGMVLIAVLVAALAGDEEDPISPE